MGRNSSRKPVEKMVIVVIIVLVLIVVQADHNPLPPSLPPSLISLCFSSLKPCEDGKHVNRKRCDERCKKSSCRSINVESVYRRCVGLCKALCLKGESHHRYHCRNFSIFSYKYINILIYAYQCGYDIYNFLFSIFI